MFVDRYAEAVTKNGQEINSPNSTDIGYGVWRLIRPDIEHIVNYAAGIRALGRFVSFPQSYLC